MDEAALRLAINPLLTAWEAPPLLAFCPDQPSELDYLTTFETAMQKMLDARDASPDSVLALGIAFASTAAGESLSYRRALKKYSRSVVFEDLGIHMFLAIEEGDVIALQPAEISPFLVDLNHWIAARRR